eukprot:557008-Amphidinium_carterae.2
MQPTLLWTILASRESTTQQHLSNTVTTPNARESVIFRLHNYESSGHYLFSGGLGPLQLNLAMYE